MFQKELEEVALMICADLPNGISENCKDIVKTFFDDVVPLIEEGLPPKVVCSMIKLCPVAQVQIMRK